MNTLVLHRPEAGDWTIAYLNDKLIYEGHSGLNDLSCEVLCSLGVEIKTVEYTDEEFQEKF